MAIHSLTSYTPRQHGMARHHGKRMGSRSPDVEVSCEYIEQAVVNSWSRVVHQLGSLAWNQQPHTVKTYLFRNITQGLRTRSESPFECDIESPGSINHGVRLPRLFVITGELDITSAIRNSLLDVITSVDVGGGPCFKPADISGVSFTWEFN